MIHSTGVTATSDEVCRNRKGCKERRELTPAQEIAAEAVKRIDQFYHLDNKFKNLLMREG
ncbi:MAG: hypothetical protein FRC54_01210 [bacterium LCO1.1]|uniref:Uncharacterized protein n=1 Tax=Candidatus Weimeria bifida TaxID=2599074 RepID=A0A6N7IZ36_9FIRM|nr:hypothetical protein [Candidatus Weimeria bifida]